MLPPPPPPPQTKPKPPSLDQTVSQQLKNQSFLESEALNSVTNKSSRPPPTLIRQPRLQRTNPVVWCAAVLCLIFSLVLIFFGVATLIFYLAIKPRNPIFDIPNASLNVIYFDSSEYFNGDFTFLTNFSNPNRKIDVRFEYLDIELFFSDRLISTHSIRPFTLRRRETRSQSVNLVSSLVFLPQEIGVKLQRQVQSNTVNYNVRGTFKMRFNVGLIHLSYWLHSRCQIEMTGPPLGVLVARQCMTNR